MDRWLLQLENKRGIVTLEMCASGVFTHTYCSCCVLILTSKDEYTNINTTKKVIAAPENGDNIHNHSVVERTAIEHSNQ